MRAWEARGAPGKPGEGLPAPLEEQEGLVAPWETWESHRRLVRAGARLGGMGTPDTPPTATYTMREPLTARTHTRTDGRTHARYL